MTAVCTLLGGGPSVCRWPNCGATPLTWGAAPSCFLPLKDASPPSALLHTI